MAGHFLARTYPASVYLTLYIKLKKTNNFLSLRNSKCSGLDRQNSSKTTSKAKM